MPFIEGFVGTYAGVGTLKTCNVGNLDAEAQRFDPLTGIHGRSAVRAFACTCGRKCDLNLTWDACKEYHSLPCVQPVHTSTVRALQPRLVGGVQQQRQPVLDLRKAGPLGVVVAQAGRNQGLRI